MVQLKTVVTVDFGLELDGFIEEVDEILPPVGNQLIKSHSFVFGRQNGTTIAKIQYL